MSSQFKPCIIRWRKPYQRWEAYAEDGRMIAHNPLYWPLKEKVNGYDFNVVPPTTSWYHNIIDRCQAKSVDI